MQQHPAGPLRPAVSPRLRATALVLLIGYLLAATWLALRPLEVMWVSPANLEPFATIRADVARGPEEALRTLGAGMVRLAPLGALLPLLGRRLGGRRFASLLRTVFAGGMLSLAIEFLQSMVPSRVADVDSIILNTTGIALAHLLCYGRLRTMTLREPRPSPPATAPRTSRRRPAPEAGQGAGAQTSKAAQATRARRTWLGPGRKPAVPLPRG